MWGSVLDSTIVRVSGDEGWGIALRRTALVQRRRLEGAVVVVVRLQEAALILGQVVILPWAAVVAVQTTGHPHHVRV